MECYRKRQSDSNRVSGSKRSKSDDMECYRKRKSDSNRMGGSKRSKSVGCVQPWDIPLPPDDPNEPFGWECVTPYREGSLARDRVDCCEKIPGGPYLTKTECYENCYGWKLGVVEPPQQQEGSEEEETRQQQGGGGGETKGGETEGGEDDCEDWVNQNYPYLQSTYNDVFESVGSVQPWDIAKVHWTNQRTDQRSRLTAKCL
jgi:hypothetical protein